MFWKGDKASKEKYKSSELLLNVLQKEYEHDLNALSNLYTRTGILFAFIGVYINFMVKKPIDLNFNIKHVCRKYLIFKLATSMSFILAIVFIIISIYFLFKVIVTNKYDRIDLDSGFDEKGSLMEKDIACYYLIEIYKKTTKKNKKILKKKSKYYNKVILFLKISLILYAVYIFSVFIGGVNITYV